MSAQETTGSADSNATTETKNDRKERLFWRTKKDVLPPKKIDEQQTGMSTPKKVGITAAALFTLGYIFHGEEMLPPYSPPRLNFSGYEDPTKNPNRAVLPQAPIKSDIKLSADTPAYAFPDDKEISWCTLHANRFAQNTLLIIEGQTKNGFVQAKAYPMGWGVAGSYATVYIKKTDNIIGLPAKMEMIKNPKRHGQYFTLSAPLQEPTTPKTATPATQASQAKPK